jgi:hypothetical protein
MGTRPNRYFNNPQMAAISSNLAGLFAPPSANDFYAMSRTEGQDYQNEAQRRAFEALVAEGVTPQDQDRFGVAMTTFGQGFNPTQTNRAVDIASADRRYGTDVGAQNNLAVQGMRNEQSGREAAFGAMVNPSGRQAVSEADILGALGVSGVPGFGAAGPVAPTDAQVLGANRQSMLDEIPGLREALAADGVGASNIVTPEGPRMAPTGLSAIGGAEPFINTGTDAAAKMTTYRTPEGRTGTAIFDPAARTLVDQATGEPLPQGTITGEISGTADEVTGAQNSRFQAQGSAIASALDTIGQLETLVSEAGASQGLVGSIRGTAQNVIQTGNELGRFFGGTMAEVAESVSAGLVDGGIASEMFDPNIPAIDMLSNVLAWQYAKSFAGDRVSNEQLRIAREAVGGSGVFANQANSLVRLGELRKMFTREAQRLGPALPPEINAMLAPHLGGPAGAAGTPTGGGAAARPRATNPETGETLEWNGQTWVPVQ